MPFRTILIFSIFLSFYVNAQKVDDTFFKKMNTYIYENPEKAIREGIRLEKNATAADIKIKYLLFLSKAYTAKRDIDKSLDVLLKAQELSQKSNNPSIKIDVFIITAIQYQHMELYNKSFEMLDKAENIAQNLDSNLDPVKNAWLGKSNAVKGIIYRSQGNYEIALSKFLKSIDYFEQAEQNKPNINNISIVYYNIAYNYIDQNNYEMAHHYFSKSLHFAEKSEAKSLQAFALKGLAQNYSIQNNPMMSLQLLNKAVVKAEKIGDLTLNEGIYKGLSNTYLTIGNFSLYHKNKEIYKKIKFDREQIELKSINSFIDNLRKNYNYQIEQLKNRNKIISHISLFFGIILCLILSYKIYQINKDNKNKAKKIQRLITNK